MATSVKCVVGACFGDEGKGLMTNLLSTPLSLVVRFNGGAQAGHTVVMPDGRRHVFHHFGSGTLKGAATYLSRHFVINPILFAKEYKALRDLGLKPFVMADPRCPVTLPFDMMMNVELERKRGVARHGSCGLGFGETLTRHAECPITLAEFLVAANPRALVDVVPLDWQEKRQNETGVTVKMDPRITSRYLEDVKLLGSKVMLAPWSQVFKKFDDVVFEGAQGLRLDMDYPGGFPHVTFSKTGLHNVAELLGETNHSSVSAYYMTRSYLTRHGSGPLLAELGKDFQDSTNVFNEHQGRMRFASHDVRVLHEDIKRDLDSVPSLEVFPSLVTTCLDQTGGKVLVSGEEWPMQDWCGWWIRKLPRMLGNGDPTGKSLRRLF